jgi:hypothetical protein
MFLGTRRYQEIDIVRGNKILTQIKSWDRIQSVKAYTNDNYAFLGPENLHTATFSYVIPSTYKIILIQET